jgi:hypothetical protein
VLSSRQARSSTKSAGRHTYDSHICAHIYEHHICEHVYDTHMCVSYMSVICTPTRSRYVWCNRVALARSVHDMAKQMYDNKLYSAPAWRPLGTWLFECDEETADKRADVLVKFNKSNTDFHKLVAQCLWNLANGSNTPWGRGATRPAFYRDIPIHEKVNRGRVLFFFVTQILACSYMCQPSVYTYRLPSYT